MTDRANYEMEFPGLNDKIASLRVDPKHTSLKSLLRRQEGLEDCCLATSRGDSYLARRKVVTVHGTVIAEDHESWLAEQLQQDGGRAPTTIRRLRSLRYLLTECSLDKLYFIQDLGGPQDNFLQIEIEVLDERLDRTLFSEHDWRDSSAKELWHLVNQSEEGERLADDARTPINPPRYRLRRVVNVAAFVHEAAELARSTNETNGARRYRVSTNGGPSVTKTLAEIVGEQPPFVWKGERLFKDWASSSAGMEGHRLCESWAMQLEDYTSPKGERDMALVPLWTHKRTMAKIARRPPSDYTLFGKLQSIDRRVGVPFAWFFYMLHGNLVDTWAGEAILNAAEQGLIVLPEHDYRVLKAWNSNTYGF